MKRLTLDEFVKEWFVKNGWDEQPKWVLVAKSIAQSYADHCEESAWISVDEQLPERWDGYPVTRNCLLFNGEDYLIGFYSYAHSQWETDDYAPIEGVTHWRPLPNPPKQ